MGVVDGAKHGQAVAFNPQQAVAESLIVLNQIEFVDTGAQGLPGPQAEGQRLREGAGCEGGKLGNVGHRLDLPESRESPRVQIVEDVQAGEFV